MDQIALKNLLHAVATRRTEPALAGPCEQMDIGVVFLETTNLGGCTVGRIVVHE
jgi:hypothetical protein